MVKGKVKFFNGQKGFGFITPDDGSKDIFVHTSNVEGGRMLQENMVVEYEAAQGRKGPEAIKVRAL